MTVIPLKRPPELQGTPIRWHKKDGKPTCLLEQIIQHTWLLVPYIAIVVSIILFLMVKGQ